MMASFDIPQMQEKLAELISRVAVLENAQAHYISETTINSSKIGQLREDVAEAKRVAEFVKVEHNQHLKDHERCEQ